MHNYSTLDGRLFELTWTCGAVFFENEPQTQVHPTIYRDAEYI